MERVLLGVITAIGGFVDAGELVTAVQAGALFRYGLVWVVVVSAVVIVVFTELAGRIVIASRRATFDVVRERLGASLAAVPLFAITVVNVLTLVAELAGMAFVLEMITGVGYLAWTPAAAVLLWLMLWKGSFTSIEDVPSLLGLLILVFVVAAVVLGTPEVPALPTPAPPGTMLYLYFAVALIGAFVAPFEVLFYGSGAMEDGWDRDDVRANRVVATVGMAFGALAAGAIMVTAGAVLWPAGIRADALSTAAIMPALALGRWGFVVFLFGAFSCCFAAGCEVAASSAYALSEYFGWNWSKNCKPAQVARFSLAYTATIVVATLIVLSTFDPIRVTEAAMVFNAVALPFVVLPLLIVANDRRYMGDLRNGAIANLVGVAAFVVTAVASVVGIPMYVLTGGGG